MNKTLKKIALVLMVIMLGITVTGCLELIQFTAEVGKDIGDTVKEVNTAKSLYQTATRNDDVDTF